MKYLYVRYFDDKTKEIPVNSQKLRSICVTDASMETEVILYAQSVVHWMFKYPNGKVDYVWLNS